MEAALKTLSNIEDFSRVKPALNLMKLYFDNIDKEPANPKYRKIRIENSKFNSTIWQLEEARTFLLLAGFEQNGEFLVLPNNISIDAAKGLIEDYINLTPGNKNHPSPSCSASSTSPSEIPNKTLKLTPSAGSSYFDQEIKADLTLLSYMIEMGFDKTSSEQALIATKNVGIQPAMDWLSTSSHLVKHEMPSSPSTTNNTQSSIMGLSSCDSKPAPTSRYQKTADERHKFQEKQRLEAIEAARLEKIAKQKHKENLLKEMLSDKKEIQIQNEMAKNLKTSGEASSGLASVNCSGQDTGEAATSQEGKSCLRIRMPGGNITDLILSNDAPVKDIYRHVTRLADLNEDDICILTMYPQRELNDKTIAIHLAGLSPRANLVVQRNDQQGVVTEGHGEVCTVKAISSMDEWQSLQQIKDKLLVVEFFATWCSKCRSISDKFESLNAEYGINQEVLFARIDIDQLKVLKYQMRVSSVPTFKLYWTGNEITSHEGQDLETLEQLIKKNRQGPDETQITDQDPR